MSEKGAGLKAHPYAEVFQLLADEQLKELADDIKAHGLRDPIWLYNGQVLDGRNRLAACRLANVEPTFRTFEGDDDQALEFVVSLNIHRRHMTDSQRAMAAAKIATMKQGARTDLASIEARSETEAARRMHVGRSSVQRAKKVIDRGSEDLQAAVVSGDVSVSKAAAVVDLPKEQQLEAARAPAPKSKQSGTPAETLDQISAAVAAADAAVDDDNDLEMTDDELAAIDREYTAAVNQIMEADDKLAAAHRVIKQQAAQIAALEATVGSYQNEKNAAVRLLQEEQRKTARMSKKLDAQAQELEQLRERVAIIDADTETDEDVPARH